jgi:hypothetical protein
MSHIVLAVCIDNCDLDAIHEANGLDSHLAIVKPVINSLYRRTIKDTSSVLKGDRVPSDIGLVLVWVPRELRDYIFT